MFTPNSVGKQPGQWPKMGKHSKFYWEKTAEEIASDDELMSIAEEKINVFGTIFEILPRKIGF